MKYLYKPIYRLLFKREITTKKHEFYFYIRYFNSGSTRIEMVFYRLKDGKRYGTDDVRINGTIIAFFHKIPRIRTVYYNS